MSYKKNLCVYMSFKITRHIYTSVISWCSLSRCLTFSLSLSLTHTLSLCLILFSFSFFLTGTFLPLRTRQTHLQSHNTASVAVLTSISRTGVMLTDHFFTTQRTTLIEVLKTVLERREKLQVLAHVHVNVPMMSPLLWRSNMNGPWASKPRFWLLSQTEHFFTTKWRSMWFSLEN